MAILRKLVLLVIVSALAIILICPMVDSDDAVQQSHRDTRAAVLLASVNPVVSCDLCPSEAGMNPVSVITASTVSPIRC